MVHALLLAASFGPFGTFAAPVTREARAEARARPEANAPPANFLWLAFQVYRTTVSAFDGPRCAHEPTCSLYGYRAVSKHGLVGLFLTADRLLRAGRSSALRAMPLVERYGVLRYHDPLEESDFWFAR